MVLSGTKKTSSLSSITNRSQSGGDKKAGLPHQIGRESWTSVAMRGTSQNLMRLHMPITSKTRMGIPINMSRVPYHGKTW
jgi:hypothetical protein